MTVSSVSLGHAATNPEVVGGQPSFPPRDSESLTGWISPHNEGDRQPFDFRTPDGRERFKEPVRGYILIPDDADNVQHVTAVLKKRISSRR